MRNYPDVMTPKKDPVNGHWKNKAAPEIPPLNSPQLYINRELSLLAFQRRVLEEAQDERQSAARAREVPVHRGLQHGRILHGAGGRLDRPGGRRDPGRRPRRHDPRRSWSPSGARSRSCWPRRTNACTTDLLPALAEAGIHILDYAALNEKQLAIADAYFSETVFPVLTPLAFDPGRPFPHISNLSLNLAVLIRDKDGEEHFARVKIPDTLPQLVPLKRPRKKSRKRPPREETFVWLEQVIAANLPALFPGMDVIEAHPFHVTRDADIAIKELEADDLLETIEEGVRQRRFGSVVRLMVSDDMPAHILDILMNNLEIDASQVYRMRGPLSLEPPAASVHARPAGSEGRALRARRAQPLVAANAEEDIFALIRRQNILLHHPFDSFQPVVDFLQKAASDPNVLAIKIMLYRVGRNSPIVEALLEAIEDGKQVAVLVELKARFDEESNIEWARALENEGVHVVYGLVGLKMHCKVRWWCGAKAAPSAATCIWPPATTTRSPRTCTRTSACSPATSRSAPTSPTCSTYLTGYSAKTDYQKLLVAPVNLRDRFEALIQREIEHCRPKARRAI